MKNMKRRKNRRFFLSLVLVSALIVSLAPQKSSSAVPWKNWVRLNQKVFYMRVGQSANIILRNSKKRVSWSKISGQSKICLYGFKRTSVWVKAQAVGTAKVCAQVSGKTYTCKIVVKEESGLVPSVTASPAATEAAQNTPTPTPTLAPTPTPTPTLAPTPTPLPTVKPTQVPTPTPVPHDATEERALQLILRNYGVPSSSDSTVPDGQEWTNGHLTKLNISDLYLPGSLDLSAFPMLQWLRCDNNLLTEINVTKNPLLETLYCNNNKLTKMDLGNNRMLQTLECVQNQFTELNLKNNVLLSTLNCSKNLFTTLDLSGNSILKALYCTEGKLVSLDISKNTMLSTVDCSFNAIEKLDVSKNVMLQSLNCTANKISGVLDLTKNYFLNVVLCTQNAITEIDVVRGDSFYIIDRNKNVPVIQKYYYPY